MKLNIECSVGMFGHCNFTQTALISNLVASRLSVLIKFLNKIWQHLNSVLRCAVSISLVYIFSSSGRARVTNNVHCWLHPVTVLYWLQLVDSSPHEHHQVHQSTAVRKMLLDFQTCVQIHHHQLFFFSKFFCGKVVSDVNPLKLSVTLCRIGQMPHHFFAFVDTAMLALNPAQLFE